MGTYCDKCGTKVAKPFYFSSYSKNSKLALFDYDFELCKSCAKQFDGYIKKWKEEE